MPATTTTRPTTFYPVRTLDGVEYAAGFYTNHRAASVAQAAWEMREVGTTYPVIAATLGMQTWSHAQLAVLAVARRTGRRERRSRTHTVGARRMVEFVTGRRFGVELEFNGHVSHSALAHRLRADGLAAEAESYNHQTRGYWKLTTDATVSGGELVSPILAGDEGWDDMRTAMRAITAQGGTVGRNAGTHVHHDVTDFTNHQQMRDLVDNLQAAQDAVMTFIPQSRWASGWCGKLSSTEFDNLRTAIDNDRLMPNVRGSSADRRHYGVPVDRYRAFNFNATLIYGTVEFRAHGGTLNAGKIRPWIAVGQAIIEFSRQGRTFHSRQSVQGMLDTLVAAGVLSQRMAVKFAARANTVNRTLVERLALDVATIPVAA
jgi:hypothetical protein